MWKILLLSSLAFGVPTKQAPTKASANEKQEMAIPQLTRDVLSRLGKPVALTKAEQKLLAEVVAAVKAKPSMQAAPEAWGQLLHLYVSRGAHGDVTAIISSVMKEAILDHKEDAKYWANKLAFHNKLAGALSEYIDEGKNKLRRAKKRSSIKVSLRALKIHHTFAEGLEPIELGPTFVVTADDLQDKLDEWDAVLTQVGEDAQRANDELIEKLRKEPRQQALRATSNVSKVLSDAATAILKKKR